jgi:hypothetical protein
MNGWQVIVDKIKAKFFEDKVNLMKKGLQE